MTTLQALIPDELHRVLQNQAAYEQVSLDELVTRSLRASVAIPLRWRTELQRVQGDSREEFARILSSVPDRPPLPGDEL